MFLALTCSEISFLNFFFVHRNFVSFCSLLAPSQRKAWYNVFRQFTYFLDHFRSTHNSQLQSSVVCLLNWTAQRAVKPAETDITRERLCKQDRCYTKLRNQATITEPSLSNISNIERTNGWKRHSLCC